MFTCLQVTVSVIVDVEDHLHQTGTPVYLERRKTLLLRLSREAKVACCCGYSSIIPPEEGLWRSTCSIITRPKSAQRVPPAPLVVRFIEKVPPMERFPTLAKTHSSGYFLLSRTGTKINNIKKPRECAVSLAEPLQFSLQVSAITLTAKPTYKLETSHEPTTFLMCTGTCILITDAGVNLDCSFMILNEWRDRV